VTGELARRAEMARREIGRSVVSVRRTEGAREDAIPFGVKDSRSIPLPMVSRLEASGRYVWLTVDKMADKGRSVDTDLHNPITYRLMTGSTSGGPVNILKGLTEFALGTDGGGSVLGPAAATNLASFIGAGLGAAGSVASASVSTDGLGFTASVGAIGKSVAGVRDFFAAACGLDLSAPPLTGSTSREEPLRIALPRRGDVSLPDGADMREKLDSYLGRLEGKRFSFGPAVFEDFDFSGAGERAAALSRMKAAFDAGFGLILSAEGPVDVFGYDETIPRSFAGPLGELLTGRGGKFLIKAANMAGSSAATVPTEELASAILVCGAPGLEGARAALAAAAELESVVGRAPLFKRYFLDQEKKNEPLIADEEEGCIP
jgi:hypothetical protein